MVFPRTCNMCANCQRKVGQKNPFCMTDQMSMSCLNFNATLIIFLVLFLLTWSKLWLEKEEKIINSIVLIILPRLQKKMKTKSIFQFFFQDSFFVRSIFFCAYKVMISFLFFWAKLIWRSCIKFFWCF